MKKFIHQIAEIKFVTGMYFVIAIIFATLGGYYFGLREFSFTTIWQIMGMSVVFGLLHYIHFTKLSTVVRVTIHNVLSYLTVLFFSLFCDWGFTSSTNAFWQFTISFIILYALVFNSFRIYYKNEDIFLNEKLNEYKNK